ncbi:MAG: nucleotidyltransferase family protein [Gammaproteobacteria bacterium]|nr:nucleotidyltransferase family protein [Gammaproteobacteria bacterium]
MNQFKNVLVHSQLTLKEAMLKLDQTALQVLLVVDSDSKLLGTITDGDIRRGLLKGLGLDEVIESIVFTTPTIGYINETNQEIIKKAVAKKLHQIPIVDAERRVVGLKEIDELLKPDIKPNKVVLMVGGLGTRLHPLTQDTPKPMLKVGDKPILQTIVERFASYGFVNIVMCVNFKAETIQSYFGDGKEFGANIEYVLEQERMGTAGALSLLTTKPSEPFFVMNGDLLTNVNFESLLDYHQTHQAVATMCVREYDFQVPYGVVNIDGHKVTSIIEKPVHNFFVSAGIYMLSPQTLDLIPNGEYYDMPTLFETLIEQNQNTVSFPIHEYWLDIGRMNEYEQANREYSGVFG